MEMVYAKAKELFGPLVSEKVKTKLNGFISFFVAPDGSKEGWEESDYADKQRAELVGFIEEQQCSDGGNPIKYAELFYGDDDRGEVGVESHN